jgi:hypothetical protein
LLYEWFNGAAGRSIAVATVAVLGTLNQHLANDYAAYGTTVADVAGAFASTDMTIVGSQWGNIPRNVARACTWLDISCGPGGGGFGDDANEAGYKVIANTFLPTIVLPSTYASFVQAATQDFLDRSPTGPELASAASDLTDLTATRRAYLAGLAASPEWTTAIVQQIYQDVLGRAGDPGGVAYWSGRLQHHTASVAAVTASLWSSTEAVQAAGGGAVDVWIGKLYQALLGRTVDPGGLAHWTSEVAARGRRAVALALVQSPESARARVTRLYQSLLGRAPDTAGLAHWAHQVVVDGDLSLAVDLASSTEYLNRSVTRFP